MTRLAQRIAGELGLGAEHNHAIAVGVVCADIGKIGLPDRLLQGRGQLSDEDYATLRSYPAMSSYILGELDLPALVKEMARWHLERWDGNGGPDGLAGDAIPIFARILAVADAVDATSFADGRTAGGHPLLPGPSVEAARALPRSRPRAARLQSPPDANPGGQTPVAMWNQDPDPAARGRRRRRRRSSR